MTIKEIDQALEEGESLKMIAQAYSEIANLKIKRIRAQVERNRLFFEEIFQVYGLVKTIANKMNVQNIKPKKTVSIVLTSNYRFYGSINSDLLEFFTSIIAKFETDIIVLGKAAVDYFRARHDFSDYQEVLLKTDQPDSAELTYLVNMIKNYTQVLVFYSSMKSLLVQKPMLADITASKQVQDSQKKENFKFIFEPELPKILQFFDSQIITLLLESTFLESELSRTASRFISMDSAETEANKLIKENLKLKARVIRDFDNNTILENFATMMAAKGVI